MTPITFKGVNALLSAPDCEDLPCHTDGLVFTTLWELSDDELEEVLMSRKIVLKVVSRNNSQPPVNLSVLKPNINIEKD